MVSVSSINDGVWERSMLCVCCSAAGVASPRPVCVCVSDWPSLIWPCSCWTSRAQSRRGSPSLGTGSHQWRERWRTTWGAALISADRRRWGPAALHLWSWRASESPDRSRRGFLLHHMLYYTQSIQSVCLGLLLLSLDRRSSCRSFVFRSHVLTKKRGRITQERYNTARDPLRTLS